MLKTYLYITTLSLSRPRIVWSHNLGLRMRYRKLICILGKEQDFHHRATRLSLNMITFIIDSQRMQEEYQAVRYSFVKLI